MWRAYKGSDILKHLNLLQITKNNKILSWLTQAFREQDLQKIKFRVNASSCPHPCKMTTFATYIFDITENYYLVWHELQQIVGLFWNPKWGWFTKVKRCFLVWGWGMGTSQLWCQLMDNWNLTNFSQLEPGGFIQ